MVVRRVRSEGAAQGRQKMEGKQEADGHVRQGFEGCGGVGREFD